MVMSPLARLWQIPFQMKKRPVLEACLVYDPVPMKSLLTLDELR
jgi:hypothetical protein